MIHYPVTNNNHVVKFALQGLLMVCCCSADSDLCHCLLLDMYLWVPQVVSAAGKNVDCNLSGSIPTQPTQVSVD